MCARSGGAGAPGGTTTIAVPQKDHRALGAAPLDYSVKKVRY